MKLEIERKFLLKNDSWKTLAQERIRIRQSYFPGSGKNFIARIRTAGNKAFLTFKAPAKDDILSRLEYEYPIPFRDAEELLDRICLKPAIEKYRYSLPDGNFLWEIDEFLGGNEGLKIAEIELPGPDTAFPHPEWLGEEVTANPCYTNFSLVKNPWPRWGKGH